MVVQTPCERTLITFTLKNNFVLLLGKNTKQCTSDRSGNQTDTHLKMIKRKEELCKHRLKAFLFLERHN